MKKLANKDGMVFVEIQKGMYGLPQAGLLAQELLEMRPDTSRALKFPKYRCTSENTAKYPSTGQDGDSPKFILIGITNKGKYYSQCQDTSRKH
ncbi:hypothetical protein ACHAW6_012058 [Cyclotella cf. meneghiniana]